MEPQKLKWRRIFLLGCERGCIWTAEIGCWPGFGLCVVEPGGKLRLGRFTCPVCGEKEVHGLPLTGPTSRRVKNPRFEVLKGLDDA